MPITKDEWIDLRWFKKDSFMVDKTLGIGADLMVYLNPKVYRYRVYPGQVLIFNKPIRARKFTLWLKVQRKGSRVLIPVIDRGMYEPLAYALAVKLDYLTFDSLPKLSKWQKCDNEHQWVMCMRKNGEVVIKIMDSHGNRIYLPQKVLASIHWKSRRMLSKKEGKNSSVIV